LDVYFDFFRQLDFFGFFHWGILPRDLWCAFGGVLRFREASATATAAPAAAAIALFLSRRSAFSRRCARSCRDSAYGRCCAEAFAARRLDRGNIRRGDRLRLRLWAARTIVTGSITPPTIASRTILA
jgi:hypothetical protein